MLRLCIVLLMRAAAGDATAEAEAQALVKLTHLFKKDPTAAETLVRAAKGSAPAPSSPSPPAPPPPPAAQPGAFTWAAAQHTMRRCMNGTTPDIRRDR